MVVISVLEFNIYTSNFNHCFKFYESKPFDLIIFANASNLSDCSCLKYRKPLTSVCVRTRLVSSSSVRLSKAIIIAVIVVYHLDVCGLF